MDSFVSGKPNRNNMSDHLSLQVTITQIQLNEQHKDLPYFIPEITRNKGQIL